jgi:TATA-binding protein-associated factor Taf7
MPEARQPSVRSLLELHTKQRCKAMRVFYSNYTDCYAYRLRQKRFRERQKNREVEETERLQNSMHHHLAEHHQAQQLEHGHQQVSLRELADQESVTQCETGSEGI